MLTFVLAVFAALPAPTAAAVAPANAGCLVRSGDKVLLVRDVWSQRWGLPGGGFEAGESPGATAARETWEETGLQVVAERHLGTTAGGFQAWGCRLAGPVAMAGPETVALPNHARGEVAEARFLDPRELSPGRMRFPSQTHLLRHWAAAAPGVDAELLELRPPAPGPLAGALRLSRVLTAPPLAPVRAALGLASGLAALPAIAMVIVWLAGWAGWRQAGELLLMTALAAFAAAVLKDVLALPRPGDLDVALATTTTRGFGFPSSHVMVVTCLWLALAVRTTLAGRRRMAAAAIGLCGLARVALGAHFLHDVAASVVVAAAGVWLHGRALDRGGVAWLSGRAWAGLWLAAAAAAAAAASVGPDQVLALGAALGFAAAAPLAPSVGRGGALWQPSPAGDGRLGATAATVALTLATAAAGALAAPREATFLASLAHRTGLAFCLGAALPVGAAVSRLRRRPSGRGRGAASWAEAGGLAGAGHHDADRHLAAGQAAAARRSG